MPATTALQHRVVVLGTELLVRATSGVCDRSRRNAAAGTADTRARIEEWAAVLSLYDAPALAG